MRSAILLLGVVVWAGCSDAQDGGEAGAAGANAGVQAAAGTAAGAAAGSLAMSGIGGAAAGAGGAAAGDGSGGAVGRSADASAGNGGTGGAAAASDTAETRVNSGCPDALPEYGDTCVTPDLRCSYGDAPRPRCRDAATCVANPNNPVHWETVRDLCAPLPDSCPESPDQPCSPEGFPGCLYPDGTDCTICQPCCDVAGCDHACDGDPEAHWMVCVPPPAIKPGCPARIPNAGTDCSDEGLVCYREQCIRDLMCMGGSWQWDSSAYAVPECDTRG